MLLEPHGDDAWPVASARGDVYSGKTGFRDKSTENASLHVGSEEDPMCTSRAKPDQLKRAELQRWNLTGPEGPRVQSIVDDQPVEGKRGHRRRQLANGEAPKDRAGQVGSTAVRRGVSMVIQMLGRARTRQGDGDLDRQEVGHGQALSRDEGVGLGHVRPTDQDL
jgi:hypothetical protein